MNTNEFFEHLQELGRTAKHAHRAALDGSTRSEFKCGHKVAVKMCMDSPSILISTWSYSEPAAQADTAAVRTQCKNNGSCTLCKTCFSSKQNFLVQLQGKCVPRSPPTQPTPFARDNGGLKSSSSRVYIGLHKSHIEDGQSVIDG